jgi:hypothetical protein
VADTTTTVLTGSSFVPGSLTAGDTYSSLTTAYYIAPMSGSSNKYNVAYKTMSLSAGAGTPAPAAATGSYSAVSGGLSSLSVAYAGATNHTIPVGNSPSYWGSMEYSGVNTGTFGGYLPTGTGDASLAALDSNGSSDMNLFTFTGSSAVGTLLTNGSGQTIDLRTLVSGGNAITEVYVPAGGGAPVPIPPSMLLLGTGLLGLIGFRRKAHKA